MKGYRWEHEAGSGVQATAPPLPKVIVEGQVQRHNTGSGLLPA